MGAGHLIPLELREAQQGAADQRRSDKRKWKSGQSLISFADAQEGVTGSSEIAL